MIFPGDFLVFSKPRGVHTHNNKWWLWEDLVESFFQSYDASLGVVCTLLVVEKMDIRPRKTCFVFRVTWYLVYI